MTPVRRALRQLFPAALPLRRPAPNGEPMSTALALIVIGLMAVAARFLYLNEIPPGLWYDEALYALDGYKTSLGQWAIFYDEHGHPREPLFPWCLGLAFTLFDPTILVARCVSALWGTAAVALFYPVALRFLPRRFALLATAAFACFRWHVHFSRTIFRAGLASPMMLATVWLFLRWRERRHWVDAVLCGAAAGACLYTYISLRLVPILLTVWIGWLATTGRLNLRREWRQVALLYGALVVVFLPLGVDYVRHPQHFAERTGEITMFEKTVTETLPDGTQRDVRVPKTAGEALSGLADNAVAVARAWFVLGDHVAKHNIPYRPVFDPVTGALFVLGLGVSVVALVRGRGLAPVILLTWFGGFCMTSVMSFGAPNILRMQGASPVVILLMMVGLHRVVRAWPPGRVTNVRGMLPLVVVGFFGVMQMNDYFRVFPRDIRVRQEFTADVFVEPARAVDEVAERVEAVYIPEEFAGSLQVRFVTVRRENIRTFAPADALGGPAAPGEGGEGAGEGGSRAWLVTQRSMQLAAEAGQPPLQGIDQVPGARVVQSFALPVESGVHPGLIVGHQTWAELWVAD